MRTILIIMLMSMFLVSCTSTPKQTGPFDAAETMKKANAKLEDKFEEEARRLFEQVMRMDVSGEYVPLAQLRIADSYVVEDLTDLAIAEYEDFLRTYARHKYASYARYQIGLVQFGLIKDSSRGYGFALEALDSLIALNVDFPRNPYRQDASLKIDQCRALLAEYEFNVGVFYYDKQACEGAVARFEAARNRFDEFVSMPELLHHLALCHDRLGNVELSGESVNELKSRFPLSSFAKQVSDDIDTQRADILKENK